MACKARNCDLTLIKQIQVVTLYIPPWEYAPLRTCGQSGGGWEEVADDGATSGKRWYSLLPLDRSLVRVCFVEVVMANTATGHPLLCGLWNNQGLQGAAGLCLPLPSLAKSSSHPQRWLQTDLLISILLQGIGGWGGELGAWGVCEQMEWGSWICFSFLKRVQVCFTRKGRCHLFEPLALGSKGASCASGVGRQEGFRWWFVIECPWLDFHVQRSLIWTAYSIFQHSPTFSASRILAGLHHIFFLNI